MATARSLIAAVNSSTKGYFVGGDSGGEGTNSQFDGFQFSDETAIDPAATLPLYGGSGTNSSTRGYFGGGMSAPSASTGMRTNIQRLEFSGETFTQLAAVIAQTRVTAAGVQNSNN